jgi:AraC-like DNA-binding protein
MGAILNDQMVRMNVTSASFSGADAVEAFREHYGRTLMQLEIEPLPDHPLDIDFTVVAAPGFSIATGKVSPTINRHPPSMIDNDDVVLIYSPQGRGCIKQFGREAQIGGSGAVFATNAEAGIFEGHATSQLRNFRFSRKLLNGLLHDIESAMARPIPEGDAILHLLTQYATVMDDADALATPELCHAIVTHMHDLASLLLGANSEGVELASRRGKRAALLRAVQSDIKSNLTSRELTPDAVARRHSLSTRVLRSLFNMESTSFTDYLREQRLTLAHRLLSDPRHAQMTVSAIAFECGFGDISYFNNSFRRRFGMTPSDVRASQLDYRT